jgi:hypothetical protein
MEVDNYHFFSSKNELLIIELPNINVCPLDKICDDGSTISSTVLFTAQILIEVPNPLPFIIS